MLAHRARALERALRRGPRAQPLGADRAARAPRSSTGTSTSPLGSAIRAGFELATGVDINVFPPERAAAELREALGR